MAANPEGWSISRLSKELGVDRRTVTRRIEGVTPSGKTNLGNLYNLRDVVVQVLHPGLLDKMDQDRIYNLEQEKARLAHFQAAEKERIVQQMDGSLVPSAEAHRVITGIISIAKSRLLGMGSRMAHQLVTASEGGPGSIKEVIDAAMEEILNEMADADLGAALGISTGNSAGALSDGGLAASGKAGDEPVG